MRPLVRAASLPAALAIVVLVGWTQGWWSGGRSARPARPLVAAATLGRQAVQFGDPLPARLDVVLDPKLVDPRSLHVRVRFAPYTVRQATRQSRRSGGAVEVSYRWTLLCLTAECVPERSKLELRFGSVLTYRTASGPKAETVDWLPFTLSSRLRDSARSDPLGNLAAVTAPPAPSYRIPPGSSADVLFVLAALAAAGAAALARLALRPSRPALPEPPLPQLSPIARAVALVRRSANGGAAGRREALEALARELRRSDGARLAGAATSLAWSPPEPRDDALLALADEVERELEEET